MKKKFLSLVGLAVLALVLTGCNLPFSKKSMAALQVAANPKATVFLDGEHKGPTPFFDESLKPGEYTLKLVPESSDVLLVPWETRIKLTKGVLTVINHEFGLSDDESSGEILSLEPISDKKTAEITLISAPDGAVVSLDGEPQGFAPLNLTGISEDDHLITVSLPGYRERDIKAKTVNGYKLSISVQLALEALPSETDSDQTEEATPSAEGEEEAEEESGVDTSPTPTVSQSGGQATPTNGEELERPFVEINSPEVGWVRVRKSPCTTESDECAELGKANDGEQYNLLDTNEVGWYQIQYTNTQTGWVSGRYAEKYE